MSEQDRNANGAVEDKLIPQTVDETRPTVLVLQMGHNDQVGHMFIKIFNSHGLHVECVKVVDGEEPSKSNLDDYHGVVVTGSAYMVTDEHPWSVKIGNAMKQVVERGNTPVLGICYGHQLLLHTIGAKVDYIQKRQIGSRVSALTPAAKSDPLFSVFQGSESIGVHVLHRQTVQGNVPAHVQVLATNSVDNYHACRIGSRCWSVQFHPELRTANIRAIIDFQKVTIVKDSIDYNEVKNSVLETSDGALLLERFASICHERFGEQKARL